MYKRQELELLAAYVSGLNECEFCFGSHRTYAEAFGFDYGIFDALFEDVHAAPIDARMKPILAYAKKLTKEPHKVIKDDVDAILDAGWNDEAVHDTAVITGLFNLMNRIIFGLGVADHAEVFAGRHSDNQKKSQIGRLAENEKALGSKNYRAFGDKIGLKESS